MTDAAPLVKTPPSSRAAEESVVGQVLANPSALAKVIATGLEPADFYHSPMKLLFEQVLESYYADDPIDPLTIAEGAERRLARLLNCPGPEAVEKVTKLAARNGGALNANASDHALLIRKHADYRSLQSLAFALMHSLEDQDAEPHEIAGGLSREAMKIATSKMLTDEILSYGDLGRNFVRSMRIARAAHAQGIELGVVFGLPFIDKFTRGIKGSELWMCAGEPGVGKSGVIWRAAQVFAERQMKKPEQNRIATFVLSLEMAEEPTNVRLAQAITGIEAGRMREGDITERELQEITNEWAKRQDLPLFFNFTSTLRASQLKALVSESVRKHNVGLVIIDHFRYFDMDQRNRDQNVEDEDKARFLKEALAKDLDVAVVCIAHTTKSIDTEDGRPHLKHLRGSGQIAAHADFVSFLYRPWNYASLTARNSGSVKSTDAEMLWVKDRHGEEDGVAFFFDPSIMQIK